MRERHSVVPGKHDGPKRVVRWIVAALVLVATGLALSLWLAPEGVERYAESLPIAEALLQEPDEVWPPRDEPSSAPREPDDDDMDAGVEPEERELAPIRRPDGSPLPPLPRSRRGFRVTEGEHDGIHYFEAVIGEATPDEALPLVVVLHGRDGRAEPPGGPFHGLTHPIRVLVPQAPDRLRDGFQWIPVYVNQGLVDELSSTLFRAAGRVARLIREVGMERGIAGKPIVTGFSQGGIMTLALALHHDDVVGWAFPIAGWLPPPLEPPYRREDLQYPTITAMHGDVDRTVPIAPTLAVFERLRELGFDARLEVFEGVGHTTNDVMNDVFHQWLEAAVCETVGDDECRDDARARARALVGDSGAEGGMDASPDGLGDSGPAAGGDSATGSDSETESGVDSGPESPRSPPPRSQRGRGV